LTTANDNKQYAIKHYNSTLVPTHNMGTGVKRTIKIIGKPYCWW